MPLWEQVKNLEAENEKRANRTLEDAFQIEALKAEISELKKQLTEVRFADLPTEALLESRDKIDALKRENADIVRVYENLYRDHRGVQDELNRLDRKLGQVERLARNWELSDDQTLLKAAASLSSVIDG